jgi:hypothetical protein
LPEKGEKENHNNLNPIIIPDNQKDKTTENNSDFLFIGIPSIIVIVLIILIILYLKYRKRIKKEI